MKLSEVSTATDLVKRRREMVSVYVDLGCATGIDQGLYGYSRQDFKIFGQSVDGTMGEVIRKAMRAEILERIAEVDRSLASLGVEVDGIEIAIKTEESLKTPRDVEEAA